MATNGESSANSTSRKLDVVIVGGSLGGLAAGIALKALGHNTTILERAPTALLHNQGAGIVAGGDTLGFFQTYDRCKRPLAVSSQCRQYFDKDGNIVHKVDMVQNMTSWDLTYHVMRANFDGVESEYCSPPKPDPSHGVAKHLHGHTVTGVEEEGQQVRVFFRKQDGEERSMLADLLVGADGPSSSIRNIFEPQVQRTYAGYCALRGTVPEEEASDAAREAFGERFAFFHGPGVQILAYLIPGANGSLEPGKRLINFVYYTNFSQDPYPNSTANTAQTNGNTTNGDHTPTTQNSPFNDLMTDATGSLHRITMPPGQIRPHIWEEQKRIARGSLPPQFAEIVCATKKPFAQAITDVISSRNAFMNGKVVLIGDALAGFRPHTVQSTSQACFDAMSLAGYVSGQTGKHDWIKETMQYARFVQRRGVEMGRRSQFERLELGELVRDRDVCSTPRVKEVYPDWTWTEEDDKWVRGIEGVVG